MGPIFAFWGTCKRGAATAVYDYANYGERLLDRPVITSSAHDDRGRARHHIETLGKRGLYYDSKESLLRLLRTFDRTAARTGDWRAYTQYAPEVVMQTFRRVFVEAPCLPASSVGQ